MDTRGPDRPQTSARAGEGGNEKAARKSQAECTR